MSIRVMLADDHRMFREALQGQLASQPDIEVVAGTSSGAETLETVVQRAALNAPSRPFGGLRCASKQK